MQSTFDVFGIPHVAVLTRDVTLALAYDYVIPVYRTYDGTGSDVILVLVPEDYTDYQIARWVANLDASTRVEPEHMEYVGEDVRAVLLRRLRGQDREGKVALLDAGTDG